VRESIERGDAQWEAGIISAFEHLDQIDIRKLRKSEQVAREWGRRNYLFHEALMAASPSRWVRHFRRILWQNSQRYRSLYLIVFDVRPGIREEHKALMDATLARDVELACRLAEEHIERSFNELATRPIEGVL
jgi:GntR family transcriptional regulator, carbon starvation induced regulator